jgi:hypothetical protein
MLRPCLLTLEFPRSFSRTVINEIFGLTKRNLSGQSVLQVHTIAAGIFPFPKLAAGFLGAVQPLTIRQQRNMFDGACSVIEEIVEGLSKEME